MLDIIHKVLQQIPIFQNLDLKEHREIIEKIELMYYPAGHMIFKSGDMADQMFIMKSGEVEIFVEKDSRRVGVALIKKGDFFGEMALIEDKKRSASAEAMTDVEVFLFGKDTLRDLMASVPDADTRVVEEYLRRKQENLENPLG